MFYLQVVYIARNIALKTVEVVIDLKPGLDNEKLDKRILRDFNEHQKKAIQNVLKGLLPQKNDSCPFKTLPD